MYLAKNRIHGTTHYIIRQSYAADACIKSRDLFDLGPDPSQFVIYPGGNSYYYDPCIADALEEKDVSADEAALDRIFFPFLRPRIQRIISDFDRGYRHRAGTQLSDRNAFVHEFDKRRYHYLRFGHSTQKFLNTVPQKIFSPLMEKSRDELEQYFQREEDGLRPHERSTYLLVIFKLIHLRPAGPGDEALSRQIDISFIDTLCELNADQRFTAGMDQFDGLHPCLTRYAIDYFDGAGVQSITPFAAMWEFMQNHRRYTPPPSVQLKIKEAETLFGQPIKKLKKMGRSELSRRYRKAAIKHHPDQGGDPETFRRLSRAYRALLRGK